MSNLFKNNRGGFTIIEILVSIVVIGILVGIVTVSFSGITKQARQAALENALIDTAGKVRAYKNQNGIYPASLSDIKITNSSNITLTLASVRNKSFCVSALGDSGIGLIITSENNNIQEGDCPFKPGSYIQTATKSSCPSTRTLAVDARDNHTYWIQKLDDGNCWMLTNLAYGGGVENDGINSYGDVIDKGTGNPGTNTINGPENPGTYYSLAKYFVPPNANPTIYPATPSVSTDGGATNPQYGYLYNWCAAMGGQDTAACKNDLTPPVDTSVSICPLGWRLPTGDNGGEYSNLNIYINNGNMDTGAGFLTKGLFQLSGYWSNGFYQQSTSGRIWPSTPQPYSGSYSLPFIYNANGVAFKYSDHKYLGNSVRCIAK